jgi:hypothetical protein
MIDFTDVIYKLNPSVVRTVGNLAYDANGNLVTYDETAVQAYLYAHAYIAKRQAEYPSFADQFDLLFHGGIEAWKASIQAVKDKYPKA